ncbi:unnamed protein product [Menidia menidia]|uniref:(Atlantic silverside) hypothetical protein n=1 Tax=Menidia menidia TaxID=238744 RepID=A0A8S4ASB1_9TELE|nr:unnamed protein product [Menidia menidia]
MAKIQHPSVSLYSSDVRSRKQKVLPSLLLGGSQCVPRPDGIFAIPPLLGLLPPVGCALKTSIGRRPEASNQVEGEGHGSRAAEDSVPAEERQEGSGEEEGSWR